MLKQLHDILVECAHRFPVPLHGNEGKKVDKFVLSSGPESLKVVATLTGDSITHAVSNIIIYIIMQLLLLLDASSSLVIFYDDNVMHLSAFPSNLPQLLLIPLFME